MSNNRENNKSNVRIDVGIEFCSFCDLDGRDAGYCVECLRNTISQGHNTPTGFYSSFNPEEFLLN